MIMTRTPFRISFLGGGTDFPSFYRNHDGHVLSAAIDKYMYLAVNKRFDSSIRLSYSKTEIVASFGELKHPIVRECLRLTGLTSGLEITSVADLPANVGLASSSSFTVGLLHALHAYKGEFVAASRLAEEACHIEIDVLREPIGKQDQYIVAHGGLQFLRFQADESVFVDPVICPPSVKKQLQSHLMLFYTGITRDAHSVLRAQENAREQNRKLLRCMAQMAHDARAVVANGGDLDCFGRLLHEGWLMKKELAPNMTNPALEECYNNAIAAGAIGGKLLGAGGGGCFLFYCPPSRQPAVRAALPHLREIPFQFEPEGSKVVFVGQRHW
jgi:D-glycero-alpha-D-manno-heptose-7-phosphate kinase